MTTIKKNRKYDDQYKDEELISEVSALRTKVNDLSSLIDVSIIINSTLDLEKLIGLVMEKAQSVMKAEASSLMLVNEEKNILECQVALGAVGEQVKKKMHLKLGEGIAGWVAVHGVPQIVTDVLKDSRFFPKIDKTTGFRTRSILAAPLIVKEKIIGVAEVINRRDGKAFDENNLELFSTFCRQVALAIEHTRMHQLELEKHKLEQQLEAAKIIQQSFMPEQFPTSPSKQFEVAAKSLPAVSVGGDFFDFIEIDNQSIAVAEGDVSGKSIPAALFMARLISDFRIFTHRYKEPSKVLNALNKILFERSRRGMFVTFIYGILNASNGELTYSNAGHIPFIKISSRKPKIELLKDAQGIPLGITPNFNFKVSKVQLNKGDILVLITDGVIEAKRKNGDVYTLNRVLDLLSQPKESARETVDTLIQDVQNFIKGNDQHDDITVVVLKWS